MKWLYYSGILLLSCVIVNGDYKKDCLVDDFKEVEYWTGEEITFYAYVLENDAVNIKLTYAFLDTTEFFTTIYFSPSIKHSKIIETKGGEDYRFDLDPMRKANNWVQFKISSHMGSIDVKCEPDTHEIIPINQTKPAFKDLKIRASNISFCEERKWKIFEEHYETIPLGRDIAHMLFTLIFNGSNGVEKSLHFLNDTYKIPLPLNEYRLVIESMNSPFKIEGNDLIKIGSSENVTTIDIFSKGGRLNVSMFLGTKSAFILSTTLELVTEVKEENCSSFPEEPCLSTLIIVAILVFIIGTIIIGIIINIKFKIFKMNLSWDRSNKEQQTNGDAKKNDQQHKLIRKNTNNSDTKEEPV